MDTVTSLHCKQSGNEEQVKNNGISVEMAVAVKTKMADHCLRLEAEAKL